MADIDSRVSAPVLMASVLLTLACHLLFFYHLDEEAVADSRQASVLLSAMEMKDSGSWLMPNVGGEKPWDHPPLYQWIAGLTSDLYDEVTPQVGRIPGALSMLILVLLASFWTYDHVLRHPREDETELNNEGIALLSGLMIATSPLIFACARSAGADAMFSCFCFGALYCLAQSLEMRRSFYAGRPWRPRVMLAYLLIGLATMTKGPTAFLFVLIPYFITCMHYRSLRPDWIHAPGLLLALVVGGWWYVAVIAMHPEAGTDFWNQLVSYRFGSDATDSRPFYYYLLSCVKFFFPWIFISAAMIYRTFHRPERTPTRLIWTWALISGLVWLSLVGSKRVEYMLPIAPFFLLLAADALAVWTFENRWGKAFRAVSRTLRWVIIIGGIPVSLIIGSDVGLVIAITLVVINFGLLFHRRRSLHVYALWERTLQGAWLLTIAFLCVQLVFVRDYIPRKGLYTPVRAFAQQIREHTPRNAHVYVNGHEDRAIYSYYMEDLLPVAPDVRRMIQEGKTETFLISEIDIRELMTYPNLATVVTRVDPENKRPDFALFKVLPSADFTTGTLEERFNFVPPLRFAFVGDAGENRDNQRDVAQELMRYNNDHPLNEIFMVGDAFTRKSLLGRLDFKRTFELPYKELVKAGVSFNYVLGEEDQQIAWDLLDQQIVRKVSSLRDEENGLSILSPLMHYPLLQLGGNRYYQKKYNGTMVRFYALDAHALMDKSKPDEEQWAMLETELAREATWKIVALHPPILSLAEEGNRTVTALTDRLLPLLDRNHVQIVVSSMEHWYQRVQDPDHAPVFFGTGWGSKTESQTFKDDPRLKKSYTEQPGFMVLEISPRQARFVAMDEDGVLVDEGNIQVTGEMTP